MKESFAGKNKNRLWIVFGLTTLYLIAEVIGGLWTHSLALIADAGHMLTDAGGLALALFAISYSEKTATPEKSYGYYRAEILAALINAMILFFISGFILYEAWQRFQQPPTIRSLPMLIVAAVGLAVNLIGMKLLATGSKGSLNVKGAYLEVLSDMLTSVGVIAAAVIMMTTGWFWIDPLISAGIGLFIIPRTWSLLRESVHILMEGTPLHVDLKALKNAMKQIKGVQEVHELHVWTLTSGLDSMSAHVSLEPGCRGEGDRILSGIQGLIKDQFQIRHSTIQLEEEGCKEPFHP